MTKIKAGLKILLSFAFLSAVVLSFLQAITYLLRAATSVDVGLARVAASAGLALCARYFWKFVVWLEKQVTD